MNKDTHAYFFAAKWPTGYRCPRCGHAHHYIIRTRRHPLYQCRHCRHQTSLTAGTIMEDSRTPLDKWYAALQLMIRPAGVNAVQLQAAIRVTYKTAWSMLMKVRKAISAFDASQRLSGTVCASLSFYGQDRWGRYPAMLREKQPFAVMAVFRKSDNPNFPAHPVYVKLKAVLPALLNNRRIPKVLEPLLMNKHIDPSNCDYSVLGSSSTFKSLFDSVYLKPHAKVLSILGHIANNWLNHVFRGIGPKYRQHYWDEFSYRFNYTAVQASVQSSAQFFEHSSVHSNAQSSWQSLLQICLQKSYVSKLSEGDSASTFKKRPKSTHNPLIA